MKNEHARWNDLLFENRNKEYGAYALRKSYDDNVSRASIFALTFAAFVFALVQILSLIEPPIKAIIEISKKHGGLISKPFIILENKPQVKQINTVQKVNAKAVPVIVTTIPQEIPPQEIVETVGNENGKVENTVEGVDLGTSALPTIIEPAKPLDFAEVMPHYEGGAEAMVQFLSKNLRYPSVAKRMGQEGTVSVRFVVNSEGIVTDIEILKGVSAVLDKEVIRVIALMNKWKPGLQHSVPVNVRMVLPIRFRLAE